MTNNNMLKSLINRLSQPATRLLRAYPMVSFLAMLGAFIAVIGLSNLLHQPPKGTVKEAPLPKTISVYRIGTAPRVTVNAEIEKTGVTTIMSQTSGIIQTVNVTTGQKISKGTKLVQLASTYAGASLPAVQRQLAQKQYIFTRDTYDLQKGTIGKNREIAEQTAKNSEEMRRIADESLSRTNDLISGSHSALDMVSQQLAFFTSQTTPSLSDAATDENLILGLKQQQLGLLSAISAAEQASRSAQLQTSNDSPPQKLAELTKETTIKQLDFQEKNLQLGLEISELNYRLAQLQENLMVPTAPFSGVVERVHVRAHEAVNPGTSLITLVADRQSLSVIALIPPSLAQRISLLEPSRLNFQNNWWEMPVGYISREPTDGSLSGITWLIADATPQPAKSKGDIINPIVTNLRDGQLVTLELPVGHPDTSSAYPFIPIDAVQQTSEASVVFVNVNGKAESRVVKLGDVYGQYIEVLEGLKTADEIILERNIVAGDQVEVKG